MTILTVSDLITTLSRFDPNTPVYIAGEADGERIEYLIAGVDFDTEEDGRVVFLNQGNWRG